MVGGRYGLSSKDTTPGQIIAVYNNLNQDFPKNNFTIGIHDDVTYTSLCYDNGEFKHPGEISCKRWGLGGDGTVGANKNAISTIGLVANKYVQAYFSYEDVYKRQTYMFVTHDLSVVKHISDNIMVMYLGQCLEFASSAELFAKPMHPYTPVSYTHLELYFS